MRGTVYKRGDKWTAMGNDKDPLTGERLRPNKSGFRTKSEAKAWLDAQESRGGSARITVNNYLTLWLEGLRQEVRPSTFDWYEGTARNHILPTIGGRKLGDLTPDHLKALYSRVGESHAKRVHKVLFRALKDAVISGRLSRNPAAMLRPPRAKPVKSPKWWSPTELQEFLEEASQHRLSAAWRFLAMTGVRRGECLGLYWSDIDWTAAKVTIQRAITQKGLGPPKTPSSYRTIDVDPETLEVLKVHRKRQTEEQLRLGSVWASKDLVFTNELGGPIDPRNFHRDFQGVVRRAGVPRIKLHEVRDTHGSQLVIAGTHPKVVMERLGHSSMSITLGLYAHVMPSLGKEAAQTAASLVADVANLLPRSSQTSGER